MKDRLDAEIRGALSQEEIEIPEWIQNRTEKTMAALPQRLPVRRGTVWLQAAAVSAACLLFVLLFVMPNLSVVYARAAEAIPGIGQLVKVLTIRNYLYDDSGHSLDAQIPMVNDPENLLAGNLINQDVDTLTSTVVHQFYRDLELSHNQGHGSVQISYDTITNTPQWFTLRLSVTETAASSNAYFRFYHIDRVSGRYVTLRDLLGRKGMRHVEKQVLQQMRQQMEADDKLVYWTEKTDKRQNHAVLEDTQNFYFRDNGDLVIIYDKYQVGPGFMGCPEFIISDYRQYLQYPAEPG